jgi:hypothetical protein
MKTKTNIAFAAAVLAAALTGGVASAHDLSEGKATEAALENFLLEGALSLLTHGNKHTAREAATEAIAMAMKNEAIARYALPRFTQILSSPKTDPVARGYIVAGMGKIAHRFPVLTDDARMGLEHAQKTEKNPQVQMEIKKQLESLKQLAQKENPTVPEQLKPMP